MSNRFILSVRADSNVRFDPLDKGGGEVHVVYTKLDGHYYSFVYFRTLDACRAAAQSEVDEDSKYH
jgi:hypothetical protein